MLEPQSRAVLLEALRPPDGFVVDRVVATTYTLDLTALLTAPLAFAHYDALLAEDPRGGEDDSAEGIDPYALLKSVRGYADRLTVFCQVGRIAIPKKFRPLLSYLEGSVVQVQAPNDDGVFHPKVWILRFVGASTDAVKYRFLCLSRNLTFDRSWDTLLSLEGDLAAGRTNAYSESRPIGDFVAALPGLATPKMQPKRRKDVELIADEIRRVKFEAPADVEAMRFHPLGIEGYAKSPFAAVERVERMLAISPFISEGALRDLTARGKGHILISRPDQLQAIRTDVLGLFSAIHVLDDAAEVEDTAVGAERTDAQLPPALGLHAKVFVADDGWNAHVWTGSANATTAALERNVEFVVQLTGKKSSLGVETVLEGRNGGGGLRPLLGTYAPAIETVGPTPVEQRLEEQLGRVRTTLARMGWSAVVGKAQDKLYPFALHARSSYPVLAAQVEVWPITLKEALAQRLGECPAGVMADFGPRSFEALTSFIAFRVRVAEGTESLEETFVLNVPLEGAPEDRMARMLQVLLGDRDKVLRFLQLLLATDLPEGMGGFGGHNAGEPTGQNASAGSVALLETLLRTLHRDPTRIDSVAEVVRDLTKTEDGANTLPDGFLALWTPIAAARESMRARGRA